MALTAKPISTISYNSREFLDRKLTQMFKANIITDYRFIFHHGEDGDKDHFHVFMFPNRRIDTGVLREEFNEVSPADDKPLGCMPFRSSKPDHWIMYVIHDPDYLRAHASDNDGDGKIPYEVTDIITPFPEQLARDYKKALPLRKTNNQQIIDQLMRDHSIINAMYQLNMNPSAIAVISNALRQESSYKHQEQIAAKQEHEQQQIQKALEVFGEVKAIEPLEQTHAEYDRQQFAYREQQMRMNFATGEVVADQPQIKQIDEKDDVHGIWEGLEYDENRK